MNGWEYRVETINTEYAMDKEGNIDNSPRSADILSECLNCVGSDGWELVAFLPALPAPHFKGSPANPYVVHAVFKRKAN